MFKKEIFNLLTYKEIIYYFFKWPLFLFSLKKEKNVIEIGCKIFPKYPPYKVLDKIIQVTGTRYDNIFILRTATGETTLLAYLLPNLIKKYNIKKFCFVTPVGKESTTFGVIQAFYPEVECYSINITQRDLNLYFKENLISYKNINFHICLFPVNVIQEQTIAVKNNSANYMHHCSFILNNLNQKEFIFRPFLLSNIATSVFDKIKNLNFDKFIFLSPEASSVLPYSDFFWVKLSEKLKSMGYDIFVNSRKKFYGNMIFDNISICEAIVVAQHAKAIIGLRSGFMETLSPIDIPKFILYTKFKWHNYTSDETLNYFTLHKYPFVAKKNLYEYSCDNYLVEELIEDICKKLEVIYGN